MKSMINPSFKITNPEGGVNQQTIGKCLDLLEADFGDTISRERLVDFFLRRRTGYTTRIPDIPTNEV